MRQKLTVICCSVLQKEVEALLSRNHPEVEPVFIDSMLHMDPERLQQAMEKVMAERPDSSFLIVYGDCHPYMSSMEGLPYCARTKGVNCTEILLGKEAYTRHKKEEAFFFLPEWCKRWKEVFEARLGFTDPSLAREFMQETRKKLLYLDTGVSPVPETTLSEISAFFGMPVEKLSVSSENLSGEIESALKMLLWTDVNENAELLLSQLREDLLLNILAHSEDIGKCAVHIASQIREIIGVRVVALFE
ncbi:MAG: DUF1638 domain-containing protein, partial [Syntrophobacteraceae bacterium]